MEHIKAIGFDLFNTLVTAEPHTLNDALERLTHSLRKSGFAFEDEAFTKAHREAAVRFLEDTRRVGRETHNRFWISAALQTLGYHVPPDDARVAKAVDAYFSAFLPNCYLIPKTTKMLQTLKGPYRLGLLSNFTHGPAAREIIDAMGLTPFFDVVLISGELGYCKPHPLVFSRLIDQLGVEKNQIIYVGDDLEYDITGAQQAGLQPIWMTYVQDQNLPFVPGYLTRRTEGPDCETLRISKWEDLLALLKKD
ncbi:MAG: HAD family hydrolase [Desulfatiglandales bacterium]